MPEVAAIDVGTNSVRLLVGDGTTSHERLMRVTRLGRGTDATGRLDPAAIEATLAALRDYRVVLDRFEVDSIRMTATSAARDAANRDEFFGPAADIVGVEPELLSGREEAALSFLGATAELDPAEGPFLVVDIGGGSTELAVGTTEVGDWRSIDVGCVRMTERFLHADPPRPEELASCLSVLSVEWDEVRATMAGLDEVRTFVGLAGTVVNVAAVELGLAAYDRAATHHFRLTRAAVEDVFRTLATEPLADRVHNPGLERERADVIVGGCCVLVSLMRNLGLDECLVSESDILDGLVASQLGR